MIISAAAALVDADDPGSIVASLHNSKGLDQVFNEKPMRLQLRLRNATNANIPVQVKRKGIPLLRIDFSTIEGTVALDPETVSCEGFAVTGWREQKLTLTATTDVMWWFIDTLIIVDLGEVTITSSPGLETIAIQLINVTYQLDEVILAPLVILAPPQNAAGAIRLAVDGGPVESTARADSAANLSTLTMTASLEPDGSIPRKADAKPYLVLSNCSGNWPGYNRPPFTHYSGSLICSSPHLGVNKPGAYTVPVTILELPSRNHEACSLSAVLPDLVTRSQPQSTHIAAYNVGFPGIDDGVTMLQVDVAQETVSIKNFTADAFSYTNIAAPVRVLLSWTVKNASYVTLSGVGIVYSEQVEFQYPITIAETTNFVLTAYDASLTTIVSKTVTVTIAPSLAARCVPYGTIMAWRGTASSIPRGWLLCNGSAGTPDLTNRFIMGSGKEVQTGARGNADRHTHAVTLPGLNLNTSWDGEHTHAMPSLWYARGMSCGHWSSIDTGGNVHAQTQKDGGHSHSVWIDLGSQETGANDGGVRPPWYALSFIMKG